MNDVRGVSRTTGLVHSITVFNHGDDDHEEVFTTCGQHYQYGHVGNFFVTTRPISCLQCVGAINK